MIQRMPWSTNVRSTRPRTTSPLTTPVTAYSVCESSCGARIQRPRRLVRMRAMAWRTRCAVDSRSNGETPAWVSALLSTATSGGSASTSGMRCRNAWTAVPAWRRLSPTHSKVGSCGSASGAAVLCHSTGAGRSGRRQESGKRRSRVSGGCAAGGTAARVRRKRSTSSGVRAGHTSASIESGAGLGSPVLSRRTWPMR